MKKAIVTYSFAFMFLAAIVVIAGTTSLWAAELDSVVRQLTANMVSLLNVIIVAIMAWSGFLIARGDSSAVQRIIYGVIGLVVLNSASAIVDFFHR